MSGKVQSGNTQWRKKSFEEVAEDERWMKLVWKVGKITKPLSAGSAWVVNGVIGIR